MRIEAVLPVRVKLAWRMLWYGEVHEPAPLCTEPWYENLTKLVNSPISTCCQRAVLQCEADNEKEPMTSLHRAAAAQGLARCYAQDAQLHPGRMRPGTITFLIEWWVAYIGGKF